METPSLVARVFIVTVVSFSAMVRLQLIDGVNVTLYRSPRQAVGATNAYPAFAFFSSSARRAFAASTDARSAATRSTTFVSPDVDCSDSGISTPSNFEATTVSRASRYESVKPSGAKVPDIWSMNILAMPISAFDTETSAAGAANEASRTSSGHSIVCITMTSPDTPVSYTHLPLPTNREG